MRKLLFCLLLIPFSPVQGQVAGVNQEILSQIPLRMKTFVDHHTVAGAVTLVAHGNEVVEFDATGMADIEASQPMQKDTIFQIMSMTKPVTAIGIMMLAEQGKLALRDPVEQYLPEFRDLRVATTSGPDAARLSIPNHAITIRDLLTHTAGIPDGGPPAIPDYRQTMSVPLDEVVRQLAKQPLLFQPGTQWSYSSPGIEILGRIIEVCSGEKYVGLHHRACSSPAGHERQLFLPAGRQDRAHRHGLRTAKTANWRAPGHDSGRRSGKVPPGRGLSAPGWGLYSTAEDLLHLYRMMLNDGVYEGHRYLSPFSVHLMTEPQTTGIHPVGWMRGSRVRPRLGGRDRSARRACRAHRRDLRTRRRLRHPGLDRPEQ